MPKLEVFLCDIFTCSKKDCFSYDEKKFVKAYYLSNKQKNFKKKCTQNVIKKKILNVHLCDIFTCSKKNCISYDVKKFMKSYYLSDKQRILNKKCTQNVRGKKYLEVHLCDIFTCSENCFSHDVSEHVKANQEQLSDKLKSLNKKFHLSKFSKKPETCNDNTEREHGTSTRTKRDSYLKTNSESESSYNIEIPVSDEEEESMCSLYDKSDYESITETEDESDYESITETETETETESSTDTDSNYCAIRDYDYEYVPRFEEEKNMDKSDSESNSGTEDSESESGTETYNRLMKERTQSEFTDRKRSVRISEKKKLRRWRLRNLVEN